MLGSVSNGGENVVNYFSLRATSSLSAEEMFRKLSAKSKYNNNNIEVTGKLNGDLEQKQTFTVDGEEVNEDGTIGEANYLKTQAQEKSTDTSKTTLFDSSGNTDLEDEFYYDGKTSSITSSFDALLAAMGVSGNKISKVQLLGFLQSLVSNNVNTASKGDEISEEIAFLKNLIAKFDTISDGQDYITSLNGIDEPQDYTTITGDQVTSPISILI